MTRALIVFAVLAPAVAHADWLSRLTVHQTLDSKFVAKPATAHAVWNKDAANSWDVALGAKYDTAFGALAEYAELGPTLEYQRNTQSDKEQNLFKAGAAADVDIGSLGRMPVVPNVILNGAYQRDQVKHTSGVTAKGRLTMLVRGGGLHAARNWYRPNRYVHAARVGFMYTPIAGFEYEDALRAKTAADEGSIGRVLGEVLLSVYPSPDCLDRKLELLFDFAYRRDVLGSLRGDDRDHTFVSGSINYYFVKATKDDKGSSRTFGIGIDVVHGEDPDQKLVKQDLVRFGAKGML